MAHKRSGGGLTTAQQAAKFLGVSVLAGAVLAGIALPAAGALGLSAKGTAAGFDDLPGELKAPPLSQASKILDSKGGLIATVYSRDRTVVPITAMSPNILKAIVDIEDSRYYEHGALDLKGILRALSNNASDGGTQGASTLTQQYVKNVFVEEAGDDATKVAQATQQTVGRKIKEMKYAIQVEKELGKKKILENYLNITFFGEQAYGIEAAAQRYFSTSAKKLTLTQAALLAGMVQSPSRYDPISNEQAALDRRNTVLARMAQLKDITPAQAAAAQKAPLGLKVSSPKNGCITAANGAGFFCDYVRETFLQNAAFGKTKTDRQKAWDIGGLTIRTTLDPKAQQALLKGLGEHVYKGDNFVAADTMVQPGTGKIVAMGQSKPYGFGKNQTQLNLSVDRNMGNSGGFQNGSTFKPITAAAALEAGYKPDQTYPSPNELEIYPDVTNCAGQVVHAHPGEGTKNESKSEVGPYSMPDALKHSINTYFVALEADIGLCPIVNMASKLGFVRADGKPLIQAASLTLGVNEVSPLTVAAAYAAFANRGVYCTPTAIEAVTGPNGKQMAVPKTLCSRAMSQNTADTLNSMLKGVVDDGTGTAADLPGRDTAGKTGTTDDRRDAWFAGYTPSLASAVWLGDPFGKGIKGRRLSMYAGAPDNGGIKVKIGPKTFDKVEGATGPAPIWRDAMLGALEGTEREHFVTVPLPDPPAKTDPNQPPDNGKGHGPGGTGPGGTGLPNPFPTFTIPPGITGGGNGRAGGGGNGGNGP
ncbi:transglycosylase domain-containing protein [Actinacidiphila bryophytorum]|uniref:Multimodular transpeptidase-transglycosylase n=2 Tax=Actinacidiphila bryophytorum TaxID=1436133 RepID=A0A9W4H1U4_9ACTN|nr:transglycosylase domain-containing protein [Actinacidiphila bryophytorum]MBM9435137.1 penicillin-binding protein [Actinacidiphila bryophytorum]CAG7643358.1 Multimodular transpeptidase-transglycosylase [Actinacidiphila bryophytorum]